MKKILNSSFFGVCFLAALLAEAYFIYVGTESLFSVIGIGVVALIMGYLLLDSIRSGLDQRMNDAKLYLDQIYREETEKSNERFTEESNLQKATYTALKKNGVQLSQHTEEIRERIETLEHNMAKALITLNTLTELQKKAMEGQRNALNYEINFNKENTKRLIQALKEENNSADIKELLMKLLTGMERSNELMEMQLNSFKNISFGTTAVESEQKSDQNEEVVELDWKDIAQQEADSFTTTEWDSDMKEPIVENLTEIGWDVDVELVLNNSADDREISEKVDETGPETYQDSETEAASEEVLTEEASAFTDNIESISEEPREEEVLDSWGDISSELNGLIGNWDDEENAPEAEAAIAAEPEAVQMTEEVIDTPEEQVTQNGVQTVDPIYTDPNKQLTADEIAALFESFGK